MCVCVLRLFVKSAAYQSVIVNGTVASACKLSWLLILMFRSEHEACTDRIVGQHSLYSVPFFQGHVELFSRFQFRKTENWSNLKAIKPQLQGL